MKSKSKIFLKWSVRSNLVLDIQNPSPFLLSLRRREEWGNEDYLKPSSFLASSFFKPPMRG